MASALFYRIAAWTFLTTLLVLLILNVLLATIGAEKLIHLLDNLPTKALLGTLGAMGTLGFFALLFGMMWNCLVVSRASIGSRIAWFLSMLFTNMLGALIYYFVVYNREKVVSKVALREVEN